MKKVLAILFLTLITLSLHAHGPSSFDAVENPFLKEFTVYPNPTSGNVTLTLEAFEDGKPLHLKVYSLIGQEMYSENISPFNGVKEMKLDFTKFPKGIYMMEISNGNQSKMKRISVI